MPVDELRAVKEKWESNGFPQVVRSVTLDGLRGFHDARIELNFPVVALAGENGTGKTTVLKALACAYQQQQPRTPSFFPGKLFMSTPWDDVEGVTLQFAVKQGNDDLNVKLNKPTSRWRGMPERPRRHVFLFDISQKMPIDALAGYAQVAKKLIALTQSQALSDEMRGRLEYVMGRDYPEARFEYEADKRVGILMQQFGEYSQFHQGAGESSSLDLFRAFDQIPNSSLLLVDEVDASLHPKAQRRLVRNLLWLARVKTLQVVMTTHSPYILEELPPEARVLLIQGAAGTEVVYRASPSLALSSIDDKEHPELTLFVEDRVAGAIARSLLSHGDPNVLRRCQIIEVGAANVVKTLGALASNGRLPYPSRAVLDGDDSDANCLSLPGEHASERQVFEDLKDAGWPKVEERLGVGFAELSAILEDAMRDPEHHKWTIYVGDRIRMNRDRVWESLVDIWVEEVLTTSAVEDFTEEVRQSLPAQS